MRVFMYVFFGGWGGWHIFMIVELLLQYVWQPHHTGVCKSQYYCAHNTQMAGHGQIYTVEHLQSYIIFPFGLAYAPPKSGPGKGWTLLDVYPTTWIKSRDLKFILLMLGAWEVLGGVHTSRPP